VGTGSGICSVDRRTGEGAWREKKAESVGQGNGGQGNKGTVRWKRVEEGQGDRD
jgi:hypothetical protein